MYECIPYFIPQILSDVWYNGEVRDVEYVIEGAKKILYFPSWLLNAIYYTSHSASSWLVHISFWWQEKADPFISECLKKVDI